MTTPLRRSLTGLVATALAGGVVAFAPATAAAPMSGSAPEVEVVQAADGSPVRTVEGMTDRFGFAPGDDLRDPLTWFARARRVAAAAGFETGSAVDGECIDGCDEGEGSEETYAFSYPVEDLDGDGTDEILSMRVTFGAEEITSTVTARSGADGTELWTSTDAGLAFVGTVPDLDGDGLVDLLGGSFEFDAAFTGGCVVPLGLSCAFGETFTEVVDLTAYRGTDASSLGSYSVDGTYSFEYEDTSLPTISGRTGSEELRVTVDDGFFGVGLVDLDGDGVHQLVHETFDATFTQRIAGTVNDTPIGYADAVVVETAEQLGGTLELVDVVGGTSETVVVLDGVLPIATVVPGPHGDRLLVDQLPELGTARQGCLFVDPAPGGCSDLPAPGSNDAAPTRALYDGDLQKLWEVPMAPESWFVYPVGGDLDGDGVDDLFELGADQETWDDTVTGISGATGATLWTADASLLELDGDRLVGARVTFFDEIAVDALVAEAGTGAVVAERRIVETTFGDEGGEDTFGFASLGLWVTPVTAGSTDLVAEFASALYTVEEYCETYEDPDGTVHEECWYEEGELLSSEAATSIVEGSDLSDLLAVDDPAFAILDVAEYDGDAAAAELVLLDVDAAGDVAVGGTIRAVRLDQSLLWELADPLWASGRVARGDGTNDVVVEDFSTGEVSVRAGRDLAVRWRAVV